MKYIVLDSTNDGILWATSDIVLCNQIRKGLLDSEVMVLDQGNPFHDTIEQTIISTYIPISGSSTSSPVMQWNFRQGRAIPLTDSATNPFYLEKRRLLWLRMPAFKKLKFGMAWATRKLTVCAIPNIEFDILLSLSLGNDVGNRHLRDALAPRHRKRLELAFLQQPVNRKDDSAIREYAYVHEMDIEEANKELLLLANGLRLEKMRLFTYSEYFVKKINLCTTSEALNDVLHDLQKKFTWDNFI
jgi:hypothetical protein